MELPLIEDRASIFVALAAVIARVAANTIDTAAPASSFTAFRSPSRPSNPRAASALEPARQPISTPIRNGSPSS